MTAFGEARARARMERMRARAESAMHRLGHVPAEWEDEDRFHATVTACKRCHRLAAIDLTERPYLFGRAYAEHCRGIR